MKRLSIIAALIFTLLVFASCNDKLDIQQSYDFSLTSWYLQSEIREGESVEIRLTLHRSGDYQDAEYHIGYIQKSGQGEVFDIEGTLLVNRELQKLSAIPNLDKSNPLEQVFTLFFRSLSSKSSEIEFFVVDNFGLKHTLTVSFDIDES